MILFTITKYLLADYALNKFLNSMNDSMSIYQEISELSEDMWFDKVIYSDIIQVEYHNCKILRIISDDSLIISFKNISVEGMNLRPTQTVGAIRLQFAKIERIVPGKLLVLKVVHNGMYWKSPPTKGR